MPVANEEEVKTLLSRVGVRYYQGSQVCVFFMAPLLNSNYAAGNQYDIFTSCVEDQGNDKKTLAWLDYEGKSTTLIGKNLSLGYNDPTLKVNMKDYQGMKGFLPPSPIFKMLFLVSEITIQGGR